MTEICVSSCVSLEMSVYLSGGECRWAAVSSIILAVGPVVDGVTPAIPSKGLDTSHKHKTLLWLEKSCFPKCDSYLAQHETPGMPKNDSAASQKTEFSLVAHTVTQLSCLGHISVKQNIEKSK